MSQYLDRVMPVEAARAQVKERRIVELANGRAVAAFDVVGVYLEFRFGVDLGLLGEQEIVIGLVGIGPIGAFVDDGLAVPDTAALAIEYAPVFLA